MNKIQAYFLFYSCLLFILNINGIAQTAGNNSLFSIKESKKFDSHLPDVKLLGKHEDSYFIYKTINDIRNIERLDSNLNFSDKVKIKDVLDNKKTFLQTVLFGNNIIVFSYSQDKGADSILTYFYQLVNPEDLTQISEPVEFLKNNGKKRLPSVAKNPSQFKLTYKDSHSEALALHGEFHSDHVGLSPNKKLLCFYPILDYTTDQQEIAYVVFDSAMNKVRKNVLALSYDQNLMDLHERRLMDDTTIIFTAVEYMNKRHLYAGTEPNYLFHLLLVGITDRINDYVIDTDNKFITDFDYLYKSSNDIMVFGYYSENKPFTTKFGYYIFPHFLSKHDKSVKGIFSGKISENEKMTLEYLPFSNDFFKKTSYDKSESDEISNLYLEAVHFGSDSSFYMLGEQFDCYVSNTNNPMGGLPIPVSEFSHCNIVVTKLSFSGTHIYTSLISKIESNGLDFESFASFTSLLSNDSLIIFYNEANRNLKEKPAKDPKFSFYGTYLSPAVVTFNEFGMYDKKKFINEDNFLFVISSCQLDERGNLFSLLIKDSSGGASNYFKYSVLNPKID